MTGKELGQQPAFPQPICADPTGGMYCASEKGLEFAGLTKREYFAALAMQGILGAPSDITSQDLGPNSRSDQKCCAKNAVAQADALLDELAKEIS